MASDPTQTTDPWPQYKLDGWDRECVVCGCKWMEEAGGDCPQCAMKDKPPEPQTTDPRVQVCEEIQSIMETYREQLASPRGVDTPGGLEHMGDVWKLLWRWDGMLNHV